MRKAGRGSRDSARGRPVLAAEGETENPPPRVAPRQRAPARPRARVPAEPPMNGAIINLLLYRLRDRQSY